MLIDTEISLSSFGYIPHTSLMQFIATATSGAYMCSCPRVSIPIVVGVFCYVKPLFVILSLVYKCTNFHRKYN